MANEQNKPVYAWCILFFLKFCKTSETFVFSHVKKKKKKNYPYLIKNIGENSISPLIRKELLRWQFRLSLMMRFYLLFFFPENPRSASEFGTECLRRAFEFPKLTWKDAEHKCSSESERLEALTNKMRGTLSWVECRSYCTCSLMFSSFTSRLLAFIFLLRILTGSFSLKLV